MNFNYHTNQSDEQFTDIRRELSPINTLGQVLTWAGTKPKDDLIRQIVLEVVVQDEFTHDVIVPYRDFFLVFDTT